MDVILEMVCRSMINKVLLCVQVGPQGVGLKVKEPKKYNFDPKSLLLQICEVHALPDCICCPAWQLSQCSVLETHHAAAFHIQ